MMGLFLLLIVIGQGYCLRRKVRNKQSNENQRYVAIHVNGQKVFNTQISIAPIRIFLH